MRVQSAILLGRMALLFFVAESPVVALLAGLCPGHDAAIVLAGAPVVAAPLGLLLARSIRDGSEDAFAEKYRRSEGSYLLAAAASLVGVILTTPGRADIGVPGLLISASGMAAALWLLWNARSAGSRPAL